MSKRIKYSDEPIEAEVIPNFLPPPEQLARAPVSVKITISLSRRSIEFFKEAAERNNTSYQRMIRHLLDSYVDQHQAALTRRSGGRSTGSHSATRCANARAVRGNHGVRRSRSMATGDRAWRPSIQVPWSPGQ